MSRLHLTFECLGDTCVGTLDSAAGKTGLLIVSGGNEIRSGAFQGQSRLAARIAAAGYPVFRYDRRGIGDSDGENRGFLESADDIRAALEAFRAIAPGVERVVGLGNCDAASALMLASGAGCDALVLSNPWTIEDDDGTPPPEAVRSRYAAKLANPREWLRLLKGQIDFGKLRRGLAQALKPKAEPTTLAKDMQAGLAKFDGPVAILLADADRTAQAFASAWPSDQRIRQCPGASHAFVELDARDWLDAQILAVLADK
ncbi:MAG: hydrolase 1, exosortase A system-associated [Sphingomonadaceae bacterium]|nr:hydrolase 1, exosortase A system-associated [Sphingomonadaceae bacterium]MCP5394248.1 hydrolase 1, exosortase A system-associated [Sphingomonadaceae bacterium]